MGCASCGKSKTTKRTVEAVVKVEEPDLIVGKSESSRLVKLRYYGGGLERSTSGCRSCSGAGKYSVKTSETIEFASDDAKNGWFKQTFSRGRDYYVTEKQAEYLLKLTFTNQSGQKANKFTKVEDE